MGKVERHQRDLAILLDAWLESGETGPIEDYIIVNSNLPGRRANLEMAHAFGNAVADRPQPYQGKLWALCRHLVRVSAEEAPANAPKELLPFCGAVGVGTLGAGTPQFSAEAFQILQALARDPRWRMREAVCFALQRMLAARRRETLGELERWVSGGDPLEMRAVAATVAEPAFLRETKTARAALRLHRLIFERVLRMPERQSEKFRILRKGLGYTVSVVVHALPGEGFALLAQLATSRDRDVQWIVRENLKKKRLANNYPEQVASTQDRGAALRPAALDKER